LVISPSSIRLVIISYKMASRNHQYSQLARREWGSAILDEAHTTLKAGDGSDSDMTTCLLELLGPVPVKLLLTGTPSITRLADMFHQVRVQ